MLGVIASERWFWCDDGMAWPTFNKMPYWVYGVQILVVMPSWISCSPRHRAKKQLWWQIPRKKMGHLTWHVRPIFMDIPMIHKFKGNCVYNLQETQIFLLSFHFQHSLTPILVLSSSTSASLDYISNSFLPVFGFYAPWPLFFSSISLPSLARHFFFSFSFSFPFLGLFFHIDAALHFFPKCLFRF